MTTLGERRAAWLVEREQELRSAWGLDWVKVRGVDVWRAPAIDGSTVEVGQHGAHWYVDCGLYYIEGNTMTEAIKAFRAHMRSEAANLRSEADAIDALLDGGKGDATREGA